MVVRELPVLALHGNESRRGPFHEVQSTVTCFLFAARLPRPRARHLLVLSLRSLCTPYRWCTYCINATPIHHFSTPNRVVLLADACIERKYLCSRTIPLVSCEYTIQYTHIRKQWNINAKLFSYNSKDFSYTTVVSTRYFVDKIVIYKRNFLPFDKESDVEVY